MKNFINLTLLLSILTTQTQAATPLTTVNEAVIAPINITKTVIIPPSVPSIIPPIALGITTAVTSGVSLFGILLTGVCIGECVTKKSSQADSDPATLKETLGYAGATALFIAAAVVSGYYTHKKRVARNKAKKELAQISTVPAVVA